MRKLQLPVRKIHRILALPMASFVVLNVTTKNSDFYYIVETVTAATMVIMTITGTTLFFATMKRRRKI